MSHPKRKSGLILLIVLGMLSLFSMLAVTYVVFSSQSRSSSLAMVRREFHGTPTPKLLNEAAMQLVRGSTDVNSVMWRQGLLGDLYGSGPSLPSGANLYGEGPVLAFARAQRPSAPAPFNQALRDNPIRQANEPWSLGFPLTTASPEAPRVLAEHFAERFLRSPCSGMRPFQNNTMCGTVEL